MPPARFQRPASDSSALSPESRPRQRRAVRRPFVALGQSRIEPGEGEIRHRAFRDLDLEAAGKTPCHVPGTGAQRIEGTQNRDPARYPGSAPGRPDQGGEIRLGEVDPKGGARRAA